MTSQGSSHGSAQIVTPPAGWTEHPPGTLYRCEVYLSQQGSVFVAATSLPGVTAQGSSEAEAIDQATKAVAAAIQNLKRSGHPVIWQQRELESGEVLRVIAVPG